jgi:hypothetical protein
MFFGKFIFITTALQRHFEGVWGSVISVQLLAIRIFIYISAEKNL